MSSVDDLTAMQKNVYLELLQHGGRATNNQLAKVAGHRFGARVWELEQMGFSITCAKVPEAEAQGCDGLTRYTLHGVPPDWTPLPMFFSAGPSTPSRGDTDVPSCPLQGPVLNSSRADRSTTRMLAPTYPQRRKSIGAMSFDEHDFVPTENLMWKTAPGIRCTRCNRYFVSHQNIPFWLERCSA